MALEQVVNGIDSVVKTTGVVASAGIVGGITAGIAAYAVSVVGSGLRSGKTILGQVKSQDLCDGALAIGGVAAIAAGAYAAMSPDAYACLQANSMPDAAIKFIGAMPFSAAAGAVGFHTAKAALTTKGVGDDVAKNLAFGAVIGGILVPGAYIAAPYISRLFSALF